MPRHKGKTEKGIGYMQDNALKGRTFGSLAEQNRHLGEWERQTADTRIHGTTQKQVRRCFEEVERPALLPLPSSRFPCFEEGQRNVNRDGHVEVAKAYDSVPPEYLGRAVWVRWDAHVVRIFNQRFEQITLHVRHEPGRFSTQDRHLDARKRSGIERGTAYNLNQAGLIGPHAGRWAEQLIQQRGIEGVRPALGLLSLARRHPAEAIEQACANAGTEAKSRYVRRGPTRDVSPSPYVWVGDVRTPGWVMRLDATKLVVLDVETTGLSPAMGDRIIELGIVVRRGEKEIERRSWLVNPERPIPPEARQVHGITDQDVASRPTFSDVVTDVCAALQDAWIVGHNVRFDVGFMAMEAALASAVVAPAGCLDTCQLASATWGLPNYQLDTVAASLGIPRGPLHRALDDAHAAAVILDRVIHELGGWGTVELEELLALHSYRPTWPDDPRRKLPGAIYDALANGREVSIGYVNGDGLTTTRIIRPVTCFPAGRHTYVRAHCTQARELRTFRLDRIRVNGVTDGHGGGSS